MQRCSRTRYQPVDNGYEIIGSRELFNRTLYGGHARDDRPERYFTFAGDLPLFMGAVTDWSQNNWGNYAKCGVLMSGLAMTPGLKIPSFYSSDVDVSSHWFHNSEDIVAVFRNGWMEYEFRQFSPWFPDVKARITAFPLMPEDGFLVHYRIQTDQRIIFCAGFGGITGFISRLEYPQVKARNFSAADCEQNTVRCGRNRALLQRGGKDALWIGASFPVQVEAGDALSLQNCAPGMFLGNKPAPGAPRVVKIFAPIGPGETLDGFIVVIRNASEDVLDKWLQCADPAGYLQQQIRLKQSAVSLQTPDPMLDLTVPPTMAALDAAWHKNTFYHGAHAYHAPFLGWRNWYGPTVIGWHDRVQTAIKAHFSGIIKKARGKEAVWYDGQDRPDLDHEGTQYHQLKNSAGFIPALLGKNDIYNMQEVALDMLFHHLEWSGELAAAKALFKDIKGVLDWEARILDPDRDGLYQNFLNTWISDGHSYNGGACAQASAYNYQANRRMARLADKLGCPAKVFQKRAREIRAAILAGLWMPSRGLIAEYLDTIGNKLIHPAPELATIYLCVDCGVVDMFQAYQLLRFTETGLRNERTLNRAGRLVFSSNWYPKKYSTCGLFAAENMHLALAYFKTGLKNKGGEILDALVDAHFTGKSPGAIGHVLTAHGVSDGGDLDFSDVSSMYLRLIVEGLFGIRFRLLDDLIEIVPGFPSAWTKADLKLKDISLAYRRDGRQEDFVLDCANKARKRIKIPLRSARIEAVRLNGARVKYNTEPAVNNCFLTVETRATGSIHLRVIHGREPLPAINHPFNVFTGQRFAAEASKGKIIGYRDPSGALKNISVSRNKLRAGVKAESGAHTVFVRVKAGQFDAWLAADFLAACKVVPAKSGAPEKAAAGKFEPLEISRYYNVALAEIHALEYKNPRPRGYSIGVRLNGRYAWDWNQGGHNAVRVDDSALRRAKGLFRAPSGLGFLTPARGPNAACVSLWDNFPDELAIKLPDKLRELAVFLVGVTNPMQSWVENGVLAVKYVDGSTESKRLVNPLNFDDWLNAAVQKENETVYFSDYNHGLIQRIRLNPGKKPEALLVRAVANEVIIGVLGISLCREL